VILIKDTTTSITIIFLFCGIISSLYIVTTSTSGDISPIPRKREENIIDPNVNVTTQDLNINNTKATVTKKLKKELKEIECTILYETEKALRLKFPSGEESWVPKSTIKSRYDSGNKEAQSIFIDSWILQKNQIAV